MKRIAVLILLATLILLTALSGCTGNAPAATPVTTVPPATVPPSPELTPTPDPFPDALPLNTPVPFGSGKKTGELTVTGSRVRPTFGWVDPSWNSPREQLESSDPLDTQKGYNTKSPQEGNTFLFVYLTAASTGTEAVWAPSPARIVVVSDGTTASYTPLASSQTVVDGEPGSQYDFQIGAGGTGGYIQPGKSNTVKGFLIYEVPASFSPETTYVVANADAQTQGVWKLV
jgi:hypothetical protein